MHERGSKRFEKMPEFKGQLLNRNNMDLIEFSLYGNIGGWDDDKKQKKPQGKKTKESLKELNLKDV